MKYSIRYVSIAALLLLFSTSALADIRIELIKGKRTIKEKVSFTIEVSHETNENPRYKEKPEFIEVSASFASPANGAIAIDGRGVQRFDEAVTVQGQRTEITYGRHTITLQVSETAVATGLVVFVRGAVVRELIGDRAGEASSASSSVNSGMEERLADLERRVKQLESEVQILKRGRRSQ
ncbi:MAG TPA: hypothetical protein VNO24_26425 [Blastocatellia bacterium]|nr:hypothetical protein [Blastocatellia bacterium]